MAEKNEIKIKVTGMEEVKQAVTELESLEVLLHMADDSIISVSRHLDELNEKIRAIDEIATKTKEANLQLGKLTKDMTIIDEVVKNVIGECRTQ